MRALAAYVVTPRQAIASALVLIIALAAGYAAIDWLFIRAVWSVSSPSECRAASGACWPFLERYFPTLIYGYFPAPERWRPDLAFALAIATIGFLLWRGRRNTWIAIGLAVLVPIAGGILLFGGVLGLKPVPPSQFGGLLLTILTSLFAIATGLPLGIALALMRSSSMPVIAGLATVWIEVWRGVPTVLALFLAVTVFPLLTPQGLEIDKLLRALLVFTVLTSALFAEAVRGGLQGIGSGQEEAATSLGLSRWASLRLIVLPQALAIATPNIINVSVALVKETTLILVVGLYDLFGVVQTAVVDPAWSGGPVTATGYLAAAAGFWVICFSLSRLSRRFEVAQGK